MTISATKIAVGVAALAVLVPALAFAATDKAQQCRAQAGFSSAGQAVSTGTLAQIIAYGDCQAAFRTNDLAAATTRLSQMKNLSAPTLASLNQKVATASAAITSLKATFDADTSTTTAFSDVHSMNTTVRVYALVLRQVWITAAADREITIVGLLNTIQTALTTQVAALPAGTIQTHDQALLADMSAKLADANTQATNAESAIVNLVPDNGNATVKASNKAALDSARAMVGVAQTDVQAARQDAQTVRQSLPATN